MKTILELQIGDKIFIWDYYLRELSIGEITAVCTSPADDIVLITYHQIIGGKNQSIVNTMSFSKDVIRCRKAINIQSMYIYCLISTDIDDILEQIENN